MEQALLPIHPDASTYIGVRRSTIFRLAAEGEIETVHIGRKTLVPRVALDEYIARLRAAKRQAGRRVAP